MGGILSAASRKGNLVPASRTRTDDSIQILPGSGPFDDARDELLPDLSRIASARGRRQTLVGGAPVSIGTLEKALTHAPSLIAADGGADALLAFGKVPDLVIGDMDSISQAARAAFADRLNHIAEQDSTDFAKALRASPAELTVAVGFIGARVDHFLACLTELARSGAPCLLLGDVDCVCIAPPALALDLAPGTRVSLWPLGPATGTSDGLRWPIDGLALSPAGRVGTSNEATGPMRLDLSGGPVALILPAEALPEMLKAVDAPPPDGASPAA